LLRRYGLFWHLIAVWKIRRERFGNLQTKAAIFAHDTHASTHASNDLLLLAAWSIKEVSEKPKKLNYTKSKFAASAAVRHETRNS
jgi:hypothetical protein